LDVVAEGERRAQVSQGERAAQAHERDSTDQSLPHQDEVGDRCRSSTSAQFTHKEVHALEASLSVSPLSTTTVLQIGLQDFDLELG